MLIEISKYLLLKLHGEDTISQNAARGYAYNSNQTG